MEENMNVRLISYSNPSKEIAEQGLYDVQELIAFCARVSNPSNQNNTETSRSRTRMRKSYC